MKRLALTVLVMVTSFGCESVNRRSLPTDFAAGEYGRCRKIIDKHARSEYRDKHVYQLERSMVDLAEGKTKPAINMLRQGRNRLDQLVGDDWKANLGSLFLDDTVRPYAGQPYEHVITRAMLACADLMGDGDDAESYALQVIQRQVQLMENYQDRSGKSISKGAYKLVAFGTYLKGIMDEEALNFNSAERQFKKVRELEPAFAYGQSSLRRAKNGAHSKKGNGVVHVISLVGMGPYRVESNEPVTQAAAAIAHFIWGAFRNRASIPNIATVKIPKLAYHRNNPSEVHVSVNGKSAGRTATVTDVDEIATAEFNALKDHIIARAVVRRAVKVAATIAAQEALTSGHKRRSATADLISLGISAAGVAWAAAEQADTRCWSLLPSKFQVLRIELPEGDHEITLRAGRRGQPTGRAQTVRVHVRDGYNTYVLGLVPSLQGGPQPLTSDPAHAGPAS